MRREGEGVVDVRARMVIGLVLCLIGAVWCLQGVGLLGGSFMSGQAVWAVIGAVCILFGVALLRPIRRHDADD